MYIHDRAAVGGWAFVPRDESPKTHLYRRSLSSKTIAFIVIIGFTVLVIGVMTIFYYHRRNTAPQKSMQEAEHRPHGILFRAFGGGRSRPDQYQQASSEDDAGNAGRSGQLSTTGGNGNGGAAATNAVNRNTSVRSVMTLPAYRPKADNGEQVLGREGERDGIDTIVDLPTAEEDEAMRDQEMEAMYQIRVTRRQQLEEREQRRQQRREARGRNDRRALDDLREQARAAGNNNNTLAELRVNVDRIKETRQRSVSSVSYADVGLARHDGTRVRANSGESERVGLLSDAASIAPSVQSAVPSPALQQRGRSASLAMSVDSDFPFPGQVTPSRDSSVSRTPRHSDGRSRAGSSPEMVEADLGVEAMPPPEYEDVPLDDRSTTPLQGPPPDYPGPYRTASQRTQREEGNSRSSPGRGVGGTPQLPSLRISRLPEIVIEPSSAHPRDGSPNSLRFRTEG